MNLSGRSLIGLSKGETNRETFYATNPASGEPLEPSFCCAMPHDLDRAARLAHEAFPIYGRATGRQKAAFLRSIASNLESVTDDLVERAHLETALPKGRLQAETTRTIAQLRLFAQVVEEGSWVMARIDRAIPGRKPAPKPDIRSVLRPLGPVAVFGASNFPLAFSVAGGDTASALAAGNPVIVKAHPAHPGTSEIVGSVLQDSVRQCGFQEGVFSLLFDSATRVATLLVKHPLVKAVGFTGSRAAGRALMDLATSRAEPIPFFAEMSSTNPVFILPGALHDRADRIATELYASFTLGAGQFCTKPGIVFLPEEQEAGGFVRRLQSMAHDSAPSHLLTSGICSSYRAAVAIREAKPGVKVLAHAPVSSGDSVFTVGTTLYEADADTFLKDPDLSSEIFGPATLVVRIASRNQLLQAARALEGHLTATVHGTEEDLRDFADLVAILETKVGRLIFNGFPTGVEVTHAMVHGGPYPATSDGQSSSVGSRAIFRFARPVCYQGFPQSSLPEELRNENPLQIWRMVDGEMTKAPAS